MFSTFLGVALAATAHTNRDAESQGFIYDDQRGNSAEVFNTKRLWFSIQNGRLAQVHGSSEFASAFEWCSDQQFHCISGGPLNVIVPKTAVEGEWEHAGIRCLTRRNTVGRLAGDCISPGDVRTKYVFERGRGLISYQRMGNGQSYVLRGTRGLFSGAE